MIIVSDKHCYAKECQQEFQGDDKDIAHNGKEFYWLQVRGYAANPVVGVPPRRAGIELFANDMCPVLSEFTEECLGIDAIVLAIAQSHHNSYVLTTQTGTT